MYFIWAAVAALCIFTSSSIARDNGQYAGTPPDIRDWFHGLRNKDGSGCCDSSDGVRLEDAEWGVEEGSYYVIVKGIKMIVPPSAVLTGPNKVGVAVVWIFQGRITCFIPGPQT